MPLGDGEQVWIPGPLWVRRDEAGSPPDGQQGQILDPAGEQGMRADPRLQWEMEDRSWVLQAGGGGGWILVDGESTRGWGTASDPSSCQ